MENTKIFENKKFGKLRMTVIENEPYFVASDVAKMLGFKKSEGAVDRYVSQKRKIYKKERFENYVRLFVFINEDSVYQFINDSLMPNAPEVRQWIANEVIPEAYKHIRKLSGDKVKINKIYFVRNTQTR